MSSFDPFPVEAQLLHTAAHDSAAEEDSGDIDAIRALFQQQGSDLRRERYHFGRTLQGIVKRILSR